MIHRLFPEPTGPLDEVQLEACYEWTATDGLRANFVASLDGVIELGGRSDPLGAPVDQAVFMILRSLCDAILVGSGTVRAEHYGRVKLRPDRRERRAARQQSPLPALAVLSDSADLDPSSHLFDTTGEEPSAPLVLTSDAAPAERIKALRASAEVIVAGERRVDAAAAVAALQERGYHRILCEGGPRVLGRLLAAGLVDELCLTLAPTLAGPGHLNLAGWEPHQPYELRLHELYEGDGLLLARYRAA
ncbi:MAG: pyrimidine reductase family protein [Acidimicrobiaceae bacterium]|nr:pyrimidine reductase family protein [Acidimicrobiaceae bacterium]